MTARDVFFLCVVLALILAIAGRRGGWLGRRGPRRVRFATLEQQIAADFPAHGDEAKALVESVLAHARPDDRALVWQKLLDATRGDIDKLRKAAPNAARSLQKIYRFLGDAADGSGGNDGDAT